MCPAGLEPLPLTQRLEKVESYCENTKKPATSDYTFIFDTSLCPLRSCKRLDRLFYSFHGSCVKDRFSAIWRGCTPIFKKTLYWVKIASPQKSILTYNKFKNQLTKIALYKVHFIDYYSKVKQT